MRRDKKEGGQGIDDNALPFDSLGAKGGSSKGPEPQASTDADIGTRTSSAGGTSQLLDVSAGPSSSVIYRSPKRPAAIPATQLDVLALVTATSPPMPSRRKWVAHSTPKPAFSREQQTVTPRKEAPGLPPTKALAQNGADNASDSDTVSEDEQTLRSYSARFRARYQSVSMRPLPGTGSSSAYAIRSRPLHSSINDKHLHRSRLPSDQNDNGDGDTTETDEEMASRAGSPTPHRSTTPNYQIHPTADAPATGADIAAAAPLALPKQNDVGPQAPVSRVIAYERDPKHMHAFSPTLGSVFESSRFAPATEPVMRRRPQRHSRKGVSGFNMARQLSELAEVGEDDESGGAFGASRGSRDSSVSLSPSPSPSRRQRLRVRRAQARKMASRSGSDTETDAELVNRLPGSETETDKSHSTQNTTAGIGSRSPSSSNSQALDSSTLTMQRGDTMRSNTSGDTTDSAEMGFFSNRSYTSVRGPYTREANQRLLRVTRGDEAQLLVRPLGTPESRGPAAAQREHGHAYGGHGNAASDGETTETDDEFFGPAHAVHYSIRPPRRVVRHLASLRARHPEPAALNLQHKSAPPVQATRPFQVNAGPRPPLPPQSFERSRFATAATTAATAAMRTSLSASETVRGPHTAPAATTTSGDGNGFGLGLSMSGAINGEATNQGPPRTSSTPMIAARPAISSAIRMAPSYAPKHPHPPVQQQQQQQHRDSNTNGLRNSSLRREFSRDPFVPASDEFTFKGAAMRRLEKTHSKSAGDAQTCANRKRALTAPSFLEAAENKRPKGGLRIKATRSTHLLEGDGEDEKEQHSGSDSRYSDIHAEESRCLPAAAPSAVSMPGISPVSSLRSSLVTGQGPSHMQPQGPLESASHAPSGEGQGLEQPPSTPKSASAPAGARTESSEKPGSAADSAADTPAIDVGSPSMDAALRREQRAHKRRHSSTSRTFASHSSPSGTARSLPLFQKELEEEKQPPPAEAYAGAVARDKGSAGGDKQDGDAASSDLLFPPIDSKTK
ncbi:hypothetical protein GGI12_004431 [Dipsacomyces acuminosporus]|nr:hypothetical protein GGI12_004431 [Dipsacomyces acuminosporus]